MTLLQVQTEFLMQLLTGPLPLIPLIVTLFAVTCYYFGKIKTRESSNKFGIYFEGFKFTLQYIILPATLFLVVSDHFNKSLNFNSYTPVIVQLAIIFILMVRLNLIKINYLLEKVNNEILHFIIASISLLAVLLTIIAQPPSISPIILSVICWFMILSLLAYKKTYTTKEKNRTKKTKKK